MNSQHEYNILNITWFSLKRGLGLFSLSLYTTAISIWLTIMGSGLIDNALNKNLDNRIILIFLSISLSLVVANISSEYLLKRSSAKTYYKIVSTLYAAINMSSISKIENINAGYLSSLLTQDLRGIEQYQQRIHQRLTPDIMVYLGTLIYLVSRSFLLGILALVLSLVPLALILFRTNQFTALQRNVQTTKDQANAVVQGIARQHDIIRAWSLMPAYETRYEKKLEAVLLEQKKLIRKDILLDEPSIFFSFLPLISVGVVGAWLYIQGDLTLAALIAILLLGKNLINPIMRLPNSMSAIHKVKAHIERCNKYLTMGDQKIPNEVEDGSEDQTLLKSDRNIHSNYAIEVNNLRFAWPAQEPLLNNYCLRIEEGEIVYFMDEIGSGKSTLMKIIAGLYPPQEGEVLIYGRSLYCHNENNHKSKIVYLETTPAVFNMTVRENLLLASPTATEVEMNEVLRQVGLTRVIEQLPNGLNTTLGSQAHVLSGGQQQSLSIARALLTKPDILILDEPTAAADQQHVDLFKDMIEKLAGKLTTLVITHDPRILHVGARCEKILEQKTLS